MRICHWMLAYPETIRHRKSNIEQFIRINSKQFGLSPLDKERKELGSIITVHCRIGIHQNFCTLSSEAWHQHIHPASAKVVCVNRFQNKCALGLAVYLALFSIQDDWINYWWLEIYAAWLDRLITSGFTVLKTNSLFWGCHSGNGFIPKVIPLSRESTALEMNFQ